MIPFNCKYTCSIFLIEPHTYTWCRYIFLLRFGQNRRILEILTFSRQVESSRTVLLIQASLPGRRPAASGATRTGPGMPAPPPEAQCAESLWIELTMFHTLFHIVSLSTGSWMVKLSMAGHGTRSLQGAVGLQNGNLGQLLVCRMDVQNLMRANREWRVPH